MADLRTMAMMPPDEQTSVDLSPRAPDMLSNLATNSLLLQYISAAGQDVQNKGPLGANVNQVTQQNIAAQNYAKLLKKMLENGGKVSVDKDKVSINYPTNAADGSLNPLGSSGQAGTPGLASGDRGTTGENLAKLNAPATNANLQGNLSAINPSSSPLDIPASDLAGLTPQDISAALGFKMKAEELGQQKIMDVAKNIIAERRLGIEQAKLGEEKQTADIKNYQYAVSQGYKGSFADFKNSTESASVKDYEYAVQQGYKGSYQDWRTELAKAGGTNVNINPVDRAAEMAEQEPMRFMDSGHLSKEIDKALTSKEFQNEVAMAGGLSDPKIARDLRMNKKKEMIQDAVRAGGGRAFDTKFDPETGEVTFKVQWPNGKVKEYSYGLY